MLAMTTSRRGGLHPTYRDALAWGASIGILQDLKELKLVLETFPVKKLQLDTVVECAKTWKFPLQDTQWELTYDNVKSMNWTKVPEDRASDREPLRNAGERPPKRQRRQVSGKVKCWSEGCNEHVPHMHPPFLDDEITAENAKSRGTLRKKPRMWDSIGAEVRIIRFRRRKVERAEMENHGTLNGCG